MSKMTSGFCDAKILSNPCYLFGIFASGNNGEKSVIEVILSKQNSYTKGARQMYLNYLQEVQMLNEL